jgi:deazaflavin-dependent oxidoreductase (nitroreductase family)
MPIWQGSSMPLEGEYAAPVTGWVADQLEKIDATGDTSVVHVQNRPVVVFTIRGVKSGKLRRVPLMRVEHDGAYAAVGSTGGAPKNPAWVASLKANPDVELQDGTTRVDLRARLVEGQEREAWWARCVAAYPSYADYQKKTERQIPVFVCEPVG